MVKKWFQKVERPAARYVDDIINVTQCQISVDLYPAVGEIELMMVIMVIYNGSESPQIQYENK